MTRRLVAKARWLRAYHRLSEANRHLTDEALRRFRHYLSTGEAPVGLGITHLGGRTYEFRVGLALRVVYVLDGEEVVLVLLGSHDEVRRFLKRQ
jgi:hypothetical protein